MNGSEHLLTIGCYVSSVCVLSAQPYNLFQRSPVPDNRLTTDEGECGYPTGSSEGSQPKIIST